MSQAYTRGFVYVIAVNGRAEGPFKIGSSADPERRLRSLQTGSPQQLLIRRQWETGSPEQMERLLHDMMSKHRRNGEWFGGTLEQIERQWIRAQRLYPDGRGVGDRSTWPSPIGRELRRRKSPEQQAKRREHARRAVIARNKNTP